MRWVFLSIIVVLLELLTYGAARGVGWGITPWLGERAARMALWGMMLISTGMLASLALRFSSLLLKGVMTWLSVLWLFILALLMVGVVYLVITKLAVVVPSISSLASWYTGTGSRLLLLLGFIGLLGLGVYNAYMPVVRQVRIKTNQPLAQPIKVGLVSDTHFGILVGNRQIDRLGELCRQQGVELLLMAGDIMDDNTDFYQKQHMQPHLVALVKSIPLGVYASLGNHDLYGHEGEIRKAIADAGVQLLADSRTLVDNRLWLVGRLDNHAQYRKPTADLLPPPDSKPVVLLDHEPTDILKNVQLPIDLQVSGHTHNGQIFPANFIVQAMNRLAYGHERINDTDVIVSSGYGFWGMPIRLGSQAELWVIELY